MNTLVVSILKAIRATQALRSLYILCNNGLFIDMGTILRCVFDCNDEIYFLLEAYPNTSNNVNKFITAFSETTIDNHLQQTSEFPCNKKIRAASVRVMTGTTQNQQVSDITNRIYKTFCGYTHANYSHIMQIYGGNLENPSFKIAGVTSERQILDHMQLVEEAAKSVSLALDFILLKIKGTRLSC